MLLADPALAKVQKLVEGQNYSAAARDSGDVLMGQHDEIVNAGTLDKIQITDSLSYDLRNADGSALGDDTVVDNMNSNMTDATHFAGSANIGFDAVNDLLKIDINGDGQWDIHQDFAISLVGINTVTFDSGTDTFTFT